MVWGLMGMTVTGVSDATLADWVEGTGVSFSVARDGARTYQAYDAVGASAPFPLDVVIDKNGVVRYVSTRYEPAEIEAVVTALLAE